MSEKNRDIKNRWRNRTIAFRMSPEEEQELNDRIRLMGYRQKQDYLIEAVLHNEVRAIGNPLMLVQFRQDLIKIETELMRVKSEADISDELLTPIRSMLEILKAFEDGIAYDQSNIVIKKQELDRLLHVNGNGISSPGHAPDVDKNENKEITEDETN